MNFNFLKSGNNDKNNKDNVKDNGVEKTTVEQPKVPVATITPTPATPKTPGLTTPSLTTVGNGNAPTTNQYSTTNQEMEKISEELFGSKIKDINTINGESGTATKANTAGTPTIQITRRHGRHLVRTGFLTVFIAAIFGIAVVSGMFVSQYNFVFMDGANSENTYGVVTQVGKLVITDKKSLKPDVLYPGDVVYITTGEGFEPGFLENLQRAKVAEVHGNAIKVVYDGEKDLKSIRSSAVFYKQYSFNDHKKDKN